MDAEWLIQELATRVTRALETPPPLCLLPAGQWSEGGALACLRICVARWPSCVVRFRLVPGLN